MKKMVIGVFARRQDAEKTINRVHKELSVPNDDISYLYRNTDDTVREMDTEKISTDTPAEGAKKGASTGAIVGAIAGIAATVGVLPVLGPLFIAGPLLTALGITGATAVGAVGGAAVGSLVGALVNLGIGKENAQRYEDEVRAGNILVAVQTERDDEAVSIMEEHDALSVDTYTLDV